MTEKDYNLDELLEESLQRLGEGKRWIQHGWEQEENYCVLGAVRSTIRDRVDPKDRKRIREKLYRILKNSLPEGKAGFYSEWGRTPASEVYQFNDDPQTKFSHIKNLLKSAIKNVKENNV